MTYQWRGGVGGSWGKAAGRAGSPGVGLGPGEWDRQTGQ